MRSFAERSQVERVIPLVERPTPTPPPEPQAIENIDGFADWYLDEGDEAGICGFDYEPSRSRRFTLRGMTFSNGYRLYLSTQDYAFVAFMAYTYRINPYFLLGVMMAESGGDCSAVSSAGAQGCFQITYRQGAGQLKNSFPSRVSSWYWAPRSNVGGEHRRPDEALGYWPRDIYVPPEQHFGFRIPKGTRQLRMTLDPVATQLESGSGALTDVSSVASFSYGVVGSALYFHYLNHYLSDHIAQVPEEIAGLLSQEDGKAMWMAAAYNQGSPRSMSLLGKYGADLWAHTRSDVVQYSRSVRDFCVDLQLGNERYGGKMSYAQFANFLQELRWTYSDTSIAWEKVLEAVKRKHFPTQAPIDLEENLKAIFRTMVETDPRLEAEDPIIDHHVLLF